MMTVSSDLRRNIVTVLVLCKCAASQCAFNRKRGKAKEWCKYGRGDKTKSNKTNGNKTKAIYTQNGMINITVTGRCLEIFIKNVKVYCHRNVTENSL
jgi:hypothetical protein